MLTIAQVCDFCTQRKRECIPLWHKIREKVSVRCLACRDSKQGCSLKKLDLRIREPPVLRTTDKGNERCAQLTAEKRRSIAQDRAMPSGTQDSTVSTVRTRARKRGAATFAEPSGIAVAGPSLEGRSLSAEGRNHQVFLHALQPYIEALANPLMGGLELSNLVLELSALQRREEREALEIAEIVEERCGLIDKMIRRMRRRATELGVDTSEDELSGDDSDGVGDEEEARDEEEGDDGQDSEGDVAE